MSTQEFNNLVLSNSEGLKPFALTLTRDQEAARDLCQETLFKAFAYKEQYKHGTNIRAWLFTIMRNIFINDYRRKARKKQVMEQLAWRQDPVSLSAEINIRLKEIQAAIHNLPVVFRTSCLLYLQGYKYHEIACVLDEPIGTIKSRIHFVRKMLQKQIDR